MFQAFLLPGISLGASAAVLPGPMQAFIINTTLSQGWRRGLLLIITPLLVDAPIILLMVFLLGQLPQAAVTLIRLGGGLLLLWIARGAWVQYRSGADLAAQRRELPPSGAGRTLLTGMMLNILSPGPYLFWGTVTGPLLLDALAVSLLHAAGFLLAFYGTFLSGLATIVLIFERLGRMDERVVRYVLLATILLLVWFATVLLAEAAGLQDVQRVAAPVLLLGIVAFALLRRPQPSPAP